MAQGASKYTRHSILRYKPNSIFSSSKKKKRKKIKKIKVLFEYTNLFFVIKNRE